MILYVVFGWAIRVAKCLCVVVGYAILVRLYSGSVQANTHYILISTLIISSYYRLLLWLKIIFVFNIVFKM